MPAGWVMEINIFNFWKEILQRTSQNFPYRNVRNFCSVTLKNAGLPFFWRKINLVIAKTYVSSRRWYNIVLAKLKALKNVNITYRIMSLSKCALMFLLKLHWKVINGFPETTAKKLKTTAFETWSKDSCQMRSIYFCLVGFFFNSKSYMF